jgi:hypothetical protein
MRMRLGNFRILQDLLINIMYPCLILCEAARESNEAPTF